MPQKFANNASSRLPSALSSAATSITLTTGDGAKFPAVSGADYAVITLEDRRVPQLEICRVTGRTGDVLTVVRAQEGTTARTWSAGAAVSLRLTAAWLDTIQTDVVNNAAASAAAVQALSDSLVNRLYPVGSLYLTTTSANPATTLGVGTWVAYGQGRALVGVGSNGETTWSAAQTKGSETHTLSSADVPAHTHSVNPPSTAASVSTNGGHSHGPNGGGNFVTDTGGSPGNFSLGGGTFRTNPSTNTGGSHSHSVSVDIAEFSSGSFGAGGAHNNVQPSIAVYVWHRTA